LAQQAPGLTTITGHVAKAERLEPTDSRAKLVVPAGFEVSTFASGLGKPRVLAVADDGTVYATRRDTGDVIMLRDHDRNGGSEAPIVVARRPQMPGIALSGTKVYLVTVKELFVAERKPDGMFGPLQRLIDDLPDAGQHADRTIAIVKDGML
jgi:glucose/arabinose dehydrogenase